MILSWLKVDWLCSFHYWSWNGHDAAAAPAIALGPFRQSLFGADTVWKTGCNMFKAYSQICIHEHQKKQKNKTKQKHVGTERHCCFLTSSPSMRVTCCFQHIHFQPSISHDGNSGATRPFELEWRIQLQAHRGCTRTKCQNACDAHGINAEYGQEIRRGGVGVKIQMTFIVSSVKSDMATNLFFSFTWILR